MTSLGYYFKFILFLLFFLSHVHNELKSSHAFDHQDYVKDDQG